MNFNHFKFILNILVEIYIFCLKKGKFFSTFNLKEKVMRLDMRNFHCCATCINFNVDKNKEGIRYFCKRLGFETKSNYVFDCWEPKENVKKLIEKQKNKL